MTSRKGKPLCQNKDRQCRPYESYYNNTRKRAFRHGKTAKGRTSELTYEQFLTLLESKNCTYCNVEIEWPLPFGEHSSSGKRVIHSSNLDRKDSTQGYTFDNTVVCCRRCNQVKSDILSYEIMLKVGALLREDREKTS